MNEPEIPYDRSIEGYLETDGLRQLQNGEPFPVRIWSDAGAYNACLRFVTNLDLRYDWHPDTGTFWVYPPYG